MTGLDQRRTNYTDAEKARVWVHLKTHNNISQASRDLGISRTTIIKWKDDWDANGLSEPLQELVDNEANRFIQQAEELRDKSMSKLTELIEMANDPKHIVAVATALGIVQDKLVAIKRAVPKTAPKAPAAKETDDDAIERYAQRMADNANARRDEIDAVTTTDAEQAQALSTEEE